ncbi:MAG: hypothetical protein H7Z16_06385 [Pyrinomonadaceae bacterium]|nr:hypothetical protein [Pyrinomonadaceae bacterium]
MIKRMVSIGMLALACLCIPCSPVQAKDDNFSDAVKVIERFYRVKHKGIPFLARAGMKTVVTAARIAGGPKRRLAEVGSVKVAYFEDQDFSSGNGVVGFRAAINAALGATWTPLIQVSSPKDGEQVYIFLRDAGEKFNVLLITIERRDASVIQVTLSPSTLAKLLKDPDEMGRAISEEATSDE